MKDACAPVIDELRCGIQKIRDIGHGILHIDHFRKFRDLAEKILRMILRLEWHADAENENPAFSFDGIDEFLEHPVRPLLCTRIKAALEIWHIILRKSPATVIPAIHTPRSHVHPEDAPLAAFFHENQWTSDITAERLLLVILAPIDIRRAGFSDAVDDDVQTNAVQFLCNCGRIGNIDVGSYRIGKARMHMRANEAPGTEEENRHGKSVSALARTPQPLLYSLLMAARRRKLRRTMKRKRAKRKAIELEPSTKRHISGALQIAAGILLVLVLQGEAGLFGTALGKILMFFFGKYSGIFAAFLIGSGLLHWLTTEDHFSVKRSAGLGLCLLSFLGMAHMTAPMEDLAVHRDELAGAIGFMASFPFVVFATPAVGFTVLGALFLVGLFITFEPDIAAIVQFFIEKSKEIKMPEAAAKTRAKKDDEDEEEKEWAKDEEDEKDDLVEQDREPPELNIVRPQFAQATIAEKPLTKPVKKKVSRDTIEMTDTRFEEWTFPTFDLLDDTRSELTVNDEELKTQARSIEEKLREFGIEVTMRDAHPGPSVTQFTLKPSEGVKISSIETLKNDLALALAAESLRIEAPIPGKSLVGIEMPNRIRTIVHLKEILESPEFTQSTSSLTLPLGRDVSGNAVVAALEDMPHLLIAGATGSGKSVCMNTFLAALLFQNAPDQLKFILIDPKRVELMPYDCIPHLLTPVITEAEKALQALRWAVAEMGRRLHRFSEVGAKNLAEYNEKQVDDSGRLPRIIIIIDELADLMMRQYRRDTETMIARIAQMARATGMHLVIATQRPSVDVITGLIKANIPTRIAFRVVSAVDSRTIIDSIGAEDLLGKGDMLYMTAATQKPVRIQGIFISTKETERIINAVKIAGGGKITEQIGLSDEDEEDGETDEAREGVELSQGPGWTQQIDLEADDNGGDSVFFDAVAVVQETGKASASLLQRRLSVGYARAAKLLDIMEKKGLIGPVRGAKAREVYMERAETAA